MELGEDQQLCHLGFRLLVRSTRIALNGHHPLHFLFEWQELLIEMLIQ